MSTSRSRNVYTCLHSLELTWAGMVTSARDEALHDVFEDSLVPSRPSHYFVRI